MTGSGGLVAANEGANAAGNNLTINHYNGVTPEIFQVLVALSTQSLERQNDQQRADIERLSYDLGLSQGILRSITKALGDHLKEGDIPFEAIPQKLEGMIAERRALMAQQSALPPDPDEQFARLQKDIDAALKSGDDEQARQLLMRKRDGKLAASEKRTETADTLLAAATRDRLDAASSEAALGDLARSRMEYLVAAEHFRLAVEMLPPSASIRWHYLMRCASTLDVHGDEKGDNAALAQAIEAYRLALKERPRESGPQDWAQTQNNLGVACWKLGERESGARHLEQATEAFSAALEEYTRERVPLDWAAAQNNLGNVFSILGKRENNTAHLERAAEAYRAALEELTRERVPLDWAAIQNNLGSTLGLLGGTKTDIECFEQAVEAFSAALKERTRERVPLDWAMTQNNLGAVLRKLGDRESGTIHLEQAVEAYAAALEELTRERVPLSWAAIQNNLGKALLSLGERESGTVHLEQAVEAFRLALEERTRERVPLGWAMTQGNLGNALLNLGERENDAALLDEALQAVEGAWEVYKGAGINQYDKSFKKRIKKIKSAISAVRGK